MRSLLIEHPHFDELCPLHELTYTKIYFFCVYFVEEGGDSPFEDLRQHLLHNGQLVRMGSGNKQARA